MRGHPRRRFPIEDECTDLQLGVDKRGRAVKTARVLAKSNSDDSTLTLHLRT